MDICMILGVLTQASARRPLVHVFINQSNETRLYSAVISNESQAHWRINVAKRTLLITKLKNANI